ncbi:DUF5808 domain-containing protein [Sphingomonas vulcanisoli]|nr:DUF5808 domain-containing protein [Sphingomonas vulcanisoli]
MQGKYTAWGLYRDPDDPRLIVPKPIPAMGWTINVGHRFGPLVLLATGVGAVAAVGMTMLYG